MTCPSTEPPGLARAPARSRPVARTLTWAQLANSVGDGAFYVTSVVVFSQLLGLSTVQIGGALTIAWGTGFGLTTLIGRLADHRGLRGAAIALSLATAVAIPLLLLAREGWAFTVVLTAYAVAQSGSAAVRQALVSVLVPPADRVVTRARVQTAANAGIGVGAALGGFALYVGSQTAYVSVFVLDAVAFAVSAALLARLPAQPAGAGTRTTVTGSDGGWSVLRDRPYVVVAALNAVLYLYMPLLSVVMPLFIAQRTGAPAWTVAGLFLVNTLGVVTLQVRAAKAVTDLRTAGRSVRRAGWMFLLACATFSLAAASTPVSVAVLVLAGGAALLVIGEVLLASGSWEIGFAMADPTRPGEWQGMYNSGIPVARAVGPLALTALILDWTGPGWLVLGGILLGAATVMSLAANRPSLGRGPEQPTTAGHA